MKKPEKTILLLDDDKNLIRLLELILKTSHYHVIHATTVGAALKKVRLKNPDLIISDIQLEGESGFDFFWGLQKICPKRMIPFIFISAYPDQDKIQRAAVMEHGGNNVFFLVKLFSPETILKVIDVALGTRPREDLEQGMEDLIPHPVD